MCALICLCALWFSVTHSLVYLLHSVELREGLVTAKAELM